jgi:hypothetical protein
MTAFAVRRTAVRPYETRRMFNGCVKAADAVWADRPGFAIIDR